MRTRCDPLATAHPPDAPGKTRRFVRAVLHVHYPQIVEAKHILMKYRPEIDGLRAVAVLPVILFHAGLGLFAGGFVGVDVFFVISGYLITTILLTEIEEDRFSLWTFYERRARRILPALFVVLLACLPFAWVWMLPEQLEAFGKSLVAVMLFGSNILFWRETGYFAPAAEEKPLLHTWSLAVEEQYYLVVPLILMVGLRRFGRNPTFWGLVILSLVSLALCEIGRRSHPSAAFYLAPTRAWELLAGSLCAFIQRHDGRQRRSQVLSGLGLGLICASVLAFDGQTPFPSLYALVPVLGTVLIILFATADTLAGRILTLRGFVGIGLISYSAYLWRWRPCRWGWPISRGGSSKHRSGAAPPGFCRDSRGCLRPRSAAWPALVCWGWAWH